MISFLLNYLKSYKLKISIIILAIGADAAASLALPWLVREWGRAALSKANIKLLYFTLFVGCICALVIAIASFLQSYLLNYIGQSIVARLRYSAVEALLSASWKEYKKRHWSEFSSRLISDITLIQEFITRNLIQLIKSPIIILGALILLFILNWKLASLTIIAVPFLAISVKKLNSKMRRINLRLQGLMEGVTRILTEIALGWETLRLLCSENYMKSKFAQQNKSHLQAYLKSSKILATGPPFVELLGSLFIMLILWVGSMEVLSGNMTLPDLLGFILYLTTASLPLRSFVSSLLQWQRCSTTLIRIKEIIYHMEKEKQGKELEIKEGRIEFKRVCFSYDETKEPTLKDISFTIMPKEIVALAGPSGAGKSTLLKLLAGLIPSGDGEICVDGQPLSICSPVSIRQNIGLIPQDVFLFSDSIKGNLTMDEEISPSILQRAVELAEAKDFIEKLPENYSTILTSKKEQLSGGEKQRLALARSFIRDYKILLLDEAMSELDLNTERRIMENILTLFKGKMTIILALHRLHNAPLVDKIILINKGRNYGIGKHSDLLKNNSFYQELWSQLKTNSSL
jgi:ABC-type multidrug transport system fused ATPase/permease subunit